MDSPPLPPSILAEQLVDTLREPLLVLATDLRVRRANRSFYRTFAVTPDATEGRLVYELGNGQWDIPALRRLLEDLLTNREAFDDYEVAHDFPSVGRKVMLLNARRVVGGGGDGTGGAGAILLAIEDVSERRRLEDERRQLETRFTSLVKNVRDHSIFTLDRSGNVTSWNDEAGRILGFAESEVLGRHFSLIFTDEDVRDGVPGHELRTALTDGRAEDERWHVRKGGERFWALGIVTPTHDASGGHTGFSKILRDMTDRKRAEEALAESERRFRALATTSGSVLYQMSADWSELQPLDGKGLVASTDELIRDWMERNIPASEHAAIRERIADCVARKCLFEMEHRVFRPDGSVGWTRSRALPVLDAAGEIVEWFGTAEDVTDRQRWIAALAEARRRLDSALIAGEVGTFEWDVANDRLWGDRNFQCIFGIEPDVSGAAPLATYAAAVHPADRDRVLGLVRRSVETGCDYEAEYRVIGTVPPRWVTARGKVERDDAGRVTRFPGVVVDVTERKLAEQLLAAQNRALERMAAGQPLPEALGALTRAAEEQSGGGAVAAILLVDDDGCTLRTGAAPGLPAEYNAAIDGLTATAGVGTCADAAARNEVVVTPDLAASPAWAGLAHLPLALGLRAAWSMPIRATDGHVLGTFGTYFRECREPTQRERQVVEGLSRAAALAIGRERAEAARRASEANFRQLAETIPQLAWMARPDGHIFWYNRRWYEYTGTTPEQMEDWGWQRVHDPAVLPVVVERWRASLATGSPFEMEFPLRGADGAFRPFLTRVAPLRDEATGAVVQWFGTNTDVTEQRRAAEERERLLAGERAARDEAEALVGVGRVLSGELELHKLVQAATDAATGLAGAAFGAFFYAVPEPQRGGDLTLYTISGAPREAFSKFPMPRATDLFGPTLRGEAVVRSDDVTADPRYGRNAPHRGMPDGHLPVRSYLAVPVRSRAGEVLGAVFLGHPERGRFTERHERLVGGVVAQAAVAIDNARLYDRERAARTEAERNSRMKDEFLATLSHELRTPLNAILGWAQILKARPSDAADVAEGLEVIERNARAQTQIIEDLLDMSRIVSGKVRLDVERLDLAGVVRAAVDTLKPAADAKGIALRAVLDPLAGPVSGDPNRLQQVFWNLLTNAVKFTPKGGRVQVLLERVNSHVEVSVIDTGEGIPPEFLPHVFDRFRQADATTTRRHGGLGLGLAIVKQLVELHGGSVRVKSGGPGAGSTFTVDLPLTAIHPEPERAVERRHPDAGPAPVLADLCVRIAGVRVLVVDDEPDARGLVRRLLEDCEAVVTTAASAAEALDRLSAERPDVLVSDIGMPGEDGYSLIRRVRALPAERGGRTPAVALTAYARAEDRMRAVVAGFEMHVTKPVEPAELITMVASLAARAKG